MRTGCASNRENSAARGKSRGKWWLHRVRARAEPGEELPRNNSPTGAVVGTVPAARAAPAAWTAPAARAAPAAAAARAALALPVLPALPAVDGGGRAAGRGRPRGGRRSRWRWVLCGDRGAVTVEAAIVMSGLVIVLVLGASAVMAVVDQVRCTDAAREAARLVARGDEGRVGAVVRAIAPVGAWVSVRREGDGAWVEVAVSRLGVELRARAYAVVEPGVVGVR